MSGGGESSAKITVDADTRNVEASGEKVARGFRGAAHEAHGIGQQLEHVGKHLAGHLIGIRALVRLLEHAGEAAKEYQKSLAEANKSVGEGVMSRAESGGRLGITGKEAASFTAPGIHSRKEGDAFLGQLAGLNTGRSRISKRDIARAVNLFRSGVFGASEITEAVREGRLDELEAQVGARTEAAGEEFKDEADARVRENTLADTAEEDKAAHGKNLRAAQAEIDARDARHPVGAAATKVLKSIPIIGAGVEVADTARMAASLDRIASNTDSKPKIPSGGTE